MTLVMGVLNVTPDSFSDGGRWLDPEVAIAHGLHLVADGANIVDVGGESTRPGAGRVPVQEELRRVLPVIQGLVDAGATVSIDTMRAEVAGAAVAAGASMINDVSGGKADPEMFAAMAEARAQVVLMHWRALSAQMQEHAAYGDVVADVIAEVCTQVHTALGVGVSKERIVVDPGIGFAKNADHNWALLAHLDQLVERGYPVLVGASRKRFLGELLADGELLGDRPAAEREHATTAVTTLAAQAGVWGVRVHDVRAARDAVAVVDRLRAS